jgi:hypothetical protein
MSFMQVVVCRGPYSYTVCVGKGKGTVVAIVEGKQKRLHDARRTMLKVFVC